MDQAWRSELLEAVKEMRSFAEGHAQRLERLEYSLMGSQNHRELSPLYSTSGTEDSVGHTADYTDTHDDGGSSGPREWYADGGNGEDDKNGFDGEDHSSMNDEAKTENGRLRQSQGRAEDEPETGMDARTDSKKRSTSSRFLHTNESQDGGQASDNVDAESGSRVGTPRGEHKGKGKFEPATSEATQSVGWGRRISWSRGSLLRPDGGEIVHYQVGIDNPHTQWALDPHKQLDDPKHNAGRCRSWNYCKSDIQGSGVSTLTIYAQGVHYISGPLNISALAITL